MTKEKLVEQLREGIEEHIRLCLKVSGIEKDISSSLSKSIMFILSESGLCLEVEGELPIYRFETHYNPQGNIGTPGMTGGVVNIGTEYALIRKDDLSKLIKAVRLKEML